MDDDPKWLSTKIQMLATLVATATYAAGFNPPGGVWQDIGGAAGHLPGDAILRSTHYHRYAVFFYCNAIAFTLSLIIVVLTLFVKPHPNKDRKKIGGMNWYLGFLMEAAMLAFTVAYGAGACRDKLTFIWYSVNVSWLFILVIYAVYLIMGKIEGRDGGSSQAQAFRKLISTPSMFALTISYVAGLSTPGGFWDSNEGGHRPGDAILGDRLHGRSLKVFVMLNTMAFVSSLTATSITIIGEPLVIRRRAIYTQTLVTALLYLFCGLLGASIVGSCRGRGSFPWLLYGVVFAGIVLYVVVHVITVMKVLQHRRWWGKLTDKVSSWMQMGRTDEEERRRSDHEVQRRASYVQLMAGLAVAITYQAGLYPPGGLWPANADGYTAGDPILLTTKARRYKGFYYCNSVSFVASMLAIFLAQQKALQEHHALEAAMILDMLGLIGAYAVGSCRDQVSTLYVVGIAGAAVVYVVIHVSYFTLGEGDTDKKNTTAGAGVGGGGAEATAGARAAGTEAGAGGENLQQDQDDGGVQDRGDRILLFSVLVASITYQAGLTPPGGFLLKDDVQSGHHAGDPVLLYNYPRRYRAFFYCNSVSFMLSIVLILLLVNPKQHRSAIKSHALTVCSAVTYVCLMGAFAAGSTQHLKQSYFIFVLAGLPSLSSAILLIRYLKGKKNKGDEPSDSASGSEPACRCSPDRFRTAVDIQNESSVYNERSVYLMTLAILVASATYPAGLDPPGGSWLSSGNGHDAGDPVMQDSRRHRYLAFFVGNTASFLASVMLILVLLLAMWAPRQSALRKRVNGGLVSLQCLGFLVAYAAGSSRQWKTSAHVGTLVSAVLLFMAIHVGLSSWLKPAEENQPGRGRGSGHDGEQATAQTAPDARSDGPRQLRDQIGSREGSAHAGEGAAATGNATI